MCSFYIKFIFILTLLFIQSINSQEDESKLHYFSRLARNCDSGGFTRFLSISIFILYVLITLGLIKAIIGLCCNQDIGMAGLGLLIESQYCEDCNYEPPHISCNTEFCLNVVFFLVAPTALLLNLCRNTCYQLLAPRPCPQFNRMHGGKDDTSKPPNSNATMKSNAKKPTMDIYRDDEDSETYDTKYVLEQLHISEQSIRTGTYQLPKLLPEK